MLRYFPWLNLHQGQTSQMKRSASAECDVAQINLARTDHVSFKQPPAGITVFVVGIKQLMPHVPCFHPRICPKFVTPLLNPCSILPFVSSVKWKLSAAAQKNMQHHMYSTPDYRQQRNQADTPRKFFINNHSLRIQSLSSLVDFHFYLIHLIFCFLTLSPSSPFCLSLHNPNQTGTLSIYLPGVTLNPPRPPPPSFVSNF